MCTRTWPVFLVALCAAIVFAADAAHADYLKTTSPTDVDKPDRDGDGFWPDAGDESCWLASSANMLGAAGYGDEDAIYSELCTQFGTSAVGFQGTALQWYISQNPGHRYRLVTEYKSSTGWDSHWTPSFIAGELRRCQYVGIAIYKSPGVGHALTVWGDDDETDPYLCYVTDSDSDYLDVMNVEIYGWTRHKDLAGAGKDLYSLDYWGANSGYLGYVVTLCPVPEPSSGALLGVATVCLWLRRRRHRPNGPVSPSA